jgi:hypothetical protein
MMKAIRKTLQTVPISAKERLPEVHPGDKLKGGLCMACTNPLGRIWSDGVLVLLKWSCDSGSIADSAGGVHTTSWMSNGENENGEGDSGATASNWLASGGCENSKGGGSAWKLVILSEYDLMIDLFPSPTKAGNTGFTRVLRSNGSQWKSM